MSTVPLPADAFPAWALLNDLHICDVKLGDVEGKGAGLVANSENLLPNDQARDESAFLLRIPHDLLLSAEAVDEYSKVDQNFKQLLEIAGRQSTRGDILLYLLSQLVACKRTDTSLKGITPTPWTEYIKFLPRYIPVPTMWSEVERLLLSGTSLETALEAKFSVLSSEFEELREKTSDLPFWNALFWEHETASLEDWVLADAWYRSRCLELPRTGDTMVPGLDMVNHSNEPTAYYDENIKDDIVLLVRPGCTVSSGQEITISYGETKSAAEMLFSYGFVERDTATQDLTLRLDAMPDDPLAKAKVHMFGRPPMVKLFRRGETIQWESPFAYFMCLNEEDGLEFRLLQDTTGEQQLRLFWQDQDVTGQAGDFEDLVQHHQLSKIFKLRAVAVVHERVGEQLDKIRNCLSNDQLQPLIAADLLREECIKDVEMLRELETSLLEDAAQMLEDEKSKLLASEQVQRYLGSMEAASNDLAQLSPGANEDEDFSYPNRTLP